MAETLIERACQRFSKELSSEDDREIKSTSINDVRQAIRLVERQLAARQCLRNLDRLKPYLDGIERYSKAIEILANAVPYLAYTWAPLKVILTVAIDSTHILDKILSAYAQIGAALPRLSMLREAFPDSTGFQQLFGFLYEDIIEFHRRAYKLIRKPAWKIFFTSAWARFESRLSALIDNIKATSQLIDQEASAIDILQAAESRRKSADDSLAREKRWESEQLQAVKVWLEAGEEDQELKLEWLKGQSYPGTTHWIVKSPKFRSWMQRGRGNPVMWLYGKPGSGKSVLSSKVISFIQSMPKQYALFFFCDYNTPAYGISAHICRVFCTQLLKLVPELVPFFYDEYLSNGKSPSADVLKPALSTILKSIEFSRLIVDGLDELPSSEHKKLISELIDLTTSAGDICKLLVCSQDLPTIRPSLSKRPTLFLGDERYSIQKDIDMIVENGLADIGDGLGGELSVELLKYMRDQITIKSEGMFLWVRLVLSLLESSPSPRELRSTIDSLPNDLEKMYVKILSNIRSRCSPANLDRVRRTFEWMLCSKEKTHVRKCELLIAASFHEGCQSLDRQSLPYQTALEICKPLIEESPGGTVGFVHSTVPQFLLDPSSGPFTTKLSAHRTIAYSCISHLIQALDFATNMPPNELTVRVGLGILGLHLYASEYWMDHLLQCVADTDPNDPCLAPLVEQASCLALSHLQLCHPSAQDFFAYVERQTVEGIDTRICRLDALPFVPALVTRILTFRNQLLRHQDSGSAEAQPRPLDPTLFSFVDRRYNETVRSLVEAEAHEGLTADELHTFRSNFGNAAFLCHIQSCSRSRNGYRTADELRGHLSRCHQNILKCYWTGCSYNDVGFTSARALRDHLNRYHGEGGNRQVPRLLRRKMAGPRTGKEPGSLTDAKKSTPTSQAGALSPLPPHGPSRLHFLMDDKLFTEKLAAFMSAQGLLLDVNPTFDNRPINLRMLFRHVIARGGFRAVTDDTMWYDISRRMGFNFTATAAASVTLINIYNHNLLKFEEAWRADNRLIMTTNNRGLPQQNVIAAPLAGQEMPQLQGQQYQTDHATSDIISGLAPFPRYFQPSPPPGKKQKVLDKIGQDLEELAKNYAGQEIPPVSGPTLPAKMSFPTASEVQQQDRPQMQFSDVMIARGRAARDNIKQRQSEPTAKYYAGQTMPLAQAHQYLMSHVIEAIVNSNLTPENRQGLRNLPPSEQLPVMNEAIDEFKQRQRKGTAGNNAGRISLLPNDQHLRVPALTVLVDIIYARVAHFPVLSFGWQLRYTKARRAYKAIRIIEKATIALGGGEQISSIIEDVINAESDWFGVSRSEEMYDERIKAKAQKYADEASVSAASNGQATAQAQELQLLQLLELLQLQMETSRSQDGRATTPAPRLFSFARRSIDGLPPGRASPREGPQDIDGGAGDPIQRTREFLTNTRIDPDTLAPPQIQTFSQMMPTLQAESHTPYS